MHEVIPSPFGCLTMVSIRLVLRNFTTYINSFKKETPKYFSTMQVYLVNEGQ